MINYRSIILIIVLFFNVASAPVSILENRKNWWLEESEQIQNDLKIAQQTKSYTLQMTEFLESDVQESLSQAVLFSRQDRKINIEEFLASDLESYLVQEYPAFISLLALNKASFSEKIEQEVISVQKEIVRLISFYFFMELGVSDENYLNDKLNFMLSSSDFRYIVKELHLFVAQDLADNYSSQIISEVSQNIKFRLNKESVLFSDRLENIIITEFETCVDEYYFKLEKKYFSYLSKTWGWFKLKGTLDKEIELLKYAKNFYDVGQESYTLPELYYAQENPWEIAYKIFPKNYILLQDNNLNYPQLVSKKKNSNYDFEYQYRIPANPNLNSFLQELDHVRFELKQKKINLNQSKTLSKRLYNQYFYTINKNFIRQNNDVEILKKKTIKNDGKIRSAQILLINENSFLAAQNIFMSKKYKAQKYFKLNNLYFDWLLVSQQKKSIDLKSFNYRLICNQKYLTNFSEVLTQSICRNLFLNRHYDNIYHNVVNYQRRLTNSLNYSNSLLAIPEDIDKKNYSLLIKRINIFQKENENLINKNKLAYETSLKKQLTLNKKNNFVKKQKISDLATEELRVLEKRIERNLKYYQTLKHADDAFTIYSLEFEEQLELIKSGRSNQKTKYIIENQTLLPILGFNEKKILKEFETRKKLQNEINQDLARIKFLTNYYRRIGIKLNQYIDVVGYYKKINKSKRYFKHQVADWEMNENNFEEIDYKCAFYLQRIFAASL